MYVYNDVFSVRDYYIQPVRLRVIYKLPHFTVIKVVHIQLMPTVTSVAVQSIV